MQTSKTTKTETNRPLSPKQQAWVNKVKSYAAKYGITYKKALMALKRG